jgi:tetratricopeptide (TPR) repeat protein
VAALAGATLALLVFLGYQLIYRPIRARNLYVAGYEDIQREEYTEANRNFDSAYDTWVMERWFFRYADAFAEKRQYALAAEKYDQLIFGMSEPAREVMIEMLNRRAYDDILDIREIHREGVLAYAEMESEVVANYDKADRLLSLLLSRNLYDYDALLAKGDNAMEWAQEDPAKYEDARVAYASLIEEYGETDTLLFRMLRYFIRTDNEPEVMRLKQLFQSDRSVEVDPEIYAELGGYLVDRSELDDVRDILFRAMDQQEDLPEIHYHLARYFRRIGEPVEEEKGLRNTLTFLDEYEPLSRSRLAILADTHGRLGELNYDREQYLTAEQHFRDGVEVYENALERGLIERSSQFGRLYAGLGDISYYVALEYDVADRLYRQAENNEFTSREMDFRQGYIHYRNGEYGEALADFYDAAGGFSRNVNLLYATANSLHNQRSYFAAEAHYRELLDRLQRRRNQINNLLVDEDPEHRQLIDYLVRVNNNLGITLHQLSQMTGDEELGARGLYYLNTSSEYAENLGRDRRTMERSSSVDLAFLNTREILYPQPNYALQLYNEIPKDFEDVRF